MKFSRLWMLEKYDATSALVVQVLTSNFIDVANIMTSCYKQLKTRSPEFHVCQVVHMGPKGRRKHNHIAIFFLFLKRGRYENILQ